MNSQARAILWAQFRTLVNYYPRAGKGGLAFTVLMGLAWYGAWATMAVFVAMLCESESSSKLLGGVLPGGLFLAFLYWQVIPILMVSIGASLDLKKLIVYPIPARSLFGMEVLLRVTTGVEVLIVLAGASLGLLLNRTIPFWAPLGLVVFAVFNLLLSAGLRDLFSRLLARRRVRELVVFLLVLVSALPQLLLAHGPRQMPPMLKRFISVAGTLPWPWISAGQIAAGAIHFSNSVSLLLWCVAAYWFGRWQFERGLNFDADAARAAERSAASSRAYMETLYRLPTMLFRDPLGALVEKELRFLSRAPRFRLVFFMGFTFGLLIWLPLTFGRHPESAMTSNYLTIVCVYSLMCLGEVTFWNMFGFDRSAAQNYFTLPVKFSAVIVAKNISAAAVVFLEITIVTLVCFALRMPVTLPKLAESVGVTVVLTLFLLSLGNLSSIYNPRPVNPSQSWRGGGANKTQALLLLVYPVVAIPLGLAYLARYAFESTAAFYGVLLFDALLGCVVYWISMDSVLSTVESNREKIVTVLSQGEGPVSA